MSSSSSVPTRRGCTYDVFLSFRGEDTRNNFVDHLFNVLNNKGISTFKDDVMLGGGQPISQALFKAIEESRLAIVVISKNYANSSWCLEELAKIMECRDQIGLRVIPVFYQVDPSDVRKQKRDFATAFQEHQDEFKGEMEKVNKWRNSLAGVAKLSGHHISAVSRGEGEIINKIVKEILVDTPARGRENSLIGIESRLVELNSKLNIEATEEVRTIGICGMGGIGKTTIARELFRRISYKFEGSSFVNDVRENSFTKKDICAMQENILRDILGVHNMSSIQYPKKGADMMQKKFCNKKVLLVLDDVNNVKQLEFLAESHEWFGPGSRIIITSREEHLLSDADTKYKPDLLSTDQSLELFSRHAFQKNSPPDRYKDLSYRVIHYTGRLPLALKVLGSFFHERQECVWKSAIDRLAKMPINRETFDTLKLSFDDLHDFEQKIFLDIAFFFKGRKVKYVTQILDSFGFDAVIGISVLTEKSLISVYNKKLRMHDLIQEMALKIVCESAPSSRIQHIHVIHDLIEKNKELDVIEAISVDCQDLEEGFRADVFESMKDLRLLDVQQEFTSREPTCLPNRLRWLCWKYYQFSSLRVADMYELVGLEMVCSKMEHLWTGQKNMLNLKFINLEGSECLIRFPDVSGAPNVEGLILSNCRNLVEVHESFGFLKRLIYLDMRCCYKLKCLSSMLEMESLETLLLNVCRSLERFPELSPCMVKLSHIHLADYHKLEELPTSIEYVSNLSFMDLSFCSSLKKIPNSICQLNCLKNLHLGSCSNLQNLPDEFGRMENLQELHLSLVPGSITFHVLTNLCNLRKLDLSDSQITHEDFPENLHGFSSLEKLNLSYNDELLLMDLT